MRLPLDDQKIARCTLSHIPNLMFPVTQERVDTGRPKQPKLHQTGCRGVTGLVPQPLFMKLRPAPLTKSKLDYLLFNTDLVRNATGPVQAVVLTGTVSRCEQILHTIRVNIWNDDEEEKSG